MIIRASDLARAVAVSAEKSLGENGLYFRSLMPQWLIEFLGEGSIIILTQDDFDALPDEVRDEMEVLKR